MPPHAATEFTPAERELLLTLSPLPPPPRDTTNAVDTMPAAISFGAALFFDKRLSGSGRFSCASCHDPAKAWTDGASLPQAESTGLRNTPTLWNAAHQRWLFWDGSADSLWSQALRPIEDPLEMNGTRLQVVQTIAGDASLTALYEKVFGQRPELGDAQPLPAVGGPRSRLVDAQVNWWQLPSSDRERVNRIFVNVGKAIAAFVGTIVTKEAPFDRFVADLRAGQLSSTALRPAAQRGLKLFIGRGNCVLCHSGPNFSNLEFHDIRVPPLNSQMQPDLGRSEGIAEAIRRRVRHGGVFQRRPHRDTRPAPGVPGCRSRRPRALQDSESAQCRAHRTLYAPGADDLATRGSRALFDSRHGRRTGRSQPRRSVAREAQPDRARDR